MFCNHCNSALKDCTCEDLEERLDSVVEKGFFEYNKCTKCEKHYARCRCKKPHLIPASMHKSLKHLNKNNIINN